jgi:hypothetical protein
MITNSDLFGMKLVIANAIWTEAKNSVMNNDPNDYSNIIWWVLGIGLILYLWLSDKKSDKES